MYIITKMSVPLAIPNDSRAIKQTNKRTNEQRINRSIVRDPNPSNIKLKLLHTISLVGYEFGFDCAFALSLSSFELSVASTCPREFLVPLSLLL